MTVLQPRALPCDSRGLGSCAFARHYLRNHFCFLFLRVLRCFSSPGSLHTRCGDGITSAGLPHSEIRASRSICLCARLIAACHVLLRLREPRHPSCALLSFPFSSRKVAFLRLLTVVADTSSCSACLGAGRRCILSITVSVLICSCLSILLSLGSLLLKATPSLS